MLHLVFLQFVVLFAFVEAFWWSSPPPQRQRPLLSSSEAMIARGEGSPRTEMLSPKGSALDGSEVQLMHEIRRKSVTSPCWKDAVTQLEGKCKERLSGEDERSRMALSFTACQLHQDGKILQRSPTCEEGTAIAECVSLLDDSYYPIYLQFRLHVDSLCFYTQEELFQERTEFAVSMLDRASTASLARLKEMGRRSVEVVSILDEVRSGQKAVADEANRTAELLVLVNARQESALGALSDGVSGTRLQLSLLKESLEVSSAHHTKAISDVDIGINRVMSAQLRSMQFAENLTSTIMQILSISEAELQRHKALMAVVAEHTERMAARAAEQQDNFLSSNAAVIEVLEKVFSMQHMISSNVETLGALFFYSAAFAVATLATATQRTADGRFFVYAALGWACFCEFRYAERIVVPWFGSRSPFRRCVVGVCAVMLLHTAVTFRSFAEVQRKIFTEELHRWSQQGSSAALSPPPLISDNAVHEKLDVLVDIVRTSLAASRSAAANESIEGNATPCNSGGRHGKAVKNHR